MSHENVKLVSDISETVSVSISSGWCDKCCVHVLYLYTKLSSGPAQTMCGTVQSKMMSDVLSSMLWMGTSKSSCFMFLVVCPSVCCFWVFSCVFILFIAGYHKWHRGSPIPVLKLTRCSVISKPIVTKRSTNLSCGYLKRTVYKLSSPWCKTLRLNLTNLTLTETVLK
jgi:hypothetical protein